MPTEPADDEARAGRWGTEHSTPRALSVAWYRLRSTARRRWSSYLALVLLIGALGGTALGAVAGARTTASSFTSLVDSTNPSELFGPIQVYNPPAGFDTGYSASAVARVAALPHVSKVKSQIGLNAFPLGPHGQTLPGDNGFSPTGSVNGEGISQDQLIITAGRLPDPKRANEFVADSGTVSQFHWHLGQTVTFGYYTNAASVAAADTGPKIAGTFKATLVGTGATEAGYLVQDDVDSFNLSIVLFTPALSRRFLQCCANDTMVAVQLDGGSRYDAAVQREFIAAFPTLHSTLQSAVALEAKADRSITPEAIALGVFGGLIGLATVVVASQVIGRLRRREESDVRVMRALGADPGMTMADGLLGVAGAIVLGVVVAVVVAIALSPFFPIGPIRPYLGARIRVDWSVTGIGFVALALVLCAIAAAFAYRTQPLRSTRRSLGHLSNAGRVAGAAGLPVAVVTGTRFALDRGDGRQPAPVRSAIIGTTLALVVICATVTFGTSLRTLVTHPALYGWNWNAEINGGGGVGDIPSKIVPALIGDRDVSQWSNAYFSTLHIDGQVVAVMGEAPGAVVQPPVLSGHGLETANEVVLGTSTLAALHKSVGDVVEVNNGTTTTPLRIVGTETMPAIGQSGNTHLEMGSGAVLLYTLIPLAARDVFDLPPGPNAILVRFRSGVSVPLGIASLDRSIYTVTGNNDPGAVIAVQRPAEIVNYRSIGDTPVELGAIFAVGVVGALGLTLLASVRRRRRDIALLKALGFTRRQVVAAIACQSTIAVAIGAIVGVPVGVVLGRFLWDHFADAIHAVPNANAPVPTLALVFAASLILANVVAVVPAGLAARTPPALLLHSE